MENKAFEDVDLEAQDEGTKEEKSGIDEAGTGKSQGQEVAQTNQLDAQLVPERDGPYAGKRSFMF